MASCFHGNNTQSCFRFSQRNMNGHLLFCIFVNIVKFCDNWNGCYVISLFKWSKASEVKTIFAGVSSEVGFKAKKLILCKGIQNRYLKYFSGCIKIRNALYSQISLAFSLTLGGAETSSIIYIIKLFFQRSQGNLSALEWALHGVEIISCGYTIYWKQLLRM